MPAKTYIGIDLGTSGCRACAIDAQGNTLTELHLALPASHINGTQVEQNPQNWWDAVLQLLDTLFANHKFDIQAISVDGTSGTLLLCDGQGIPLTPGLMYNDTRAQAAAVNLKHIAPTDSPVHSASSALAKLLHLQEQGIDATHALHQADWIVGQLSGNYGLSDENNALKLGYDLIQRRWPNWMDQLVQNMACLPKVYPVGSVIAQVQPELLERWQYPHPVNIIAGTTDSNAATLAAGIGQVGDAVTSLGSTLALKVLSDKPIFSSEYGIYSHRIGQHWLVGGASNTGGQVLAQFFTPGEIDRLSQLIQPQQSSPLNYYPLSKPGERFPINDPQLKPRLSPRPENDADFLHGLLEGIGLIEQQAYQRLHELGAPYPKHVLGSGGGAKNKAWQAIRERLLGVPVSCAGQTQAAYGSALLARSLHQN